MSPSTISADLTFLNHIPGVLVMVAIMPVQTWLFARDHKKHGHGRPEARFLFSLGAVWLFPISLIWYAFTCDGNTNYWSPIVAGAVLGFAEALIWLSMLNYVTGKLSHKRLSSRSDRNHRLLSRRCCICNSGFPCSIFRPCCRTVSSWHSNDQQHDD